MNHLTVKRQILQLVGQNVRTYDANGALICFARKKAFKLKEEMVFWKDESQQEQLFRAKARSVIDIGATYDITSPDGTLVASLKRNGLSSTFVRDEWLILDRDGAPVGRILEDSNALGVLRRYVDLVSLFIPQKYHVFWGDTEVGTLQQNKNPFTMRFTALYGDQATAMGDTLKVAIPSVLAVLEGRQ